MIEFASHYWQIYSRYVGGIEDKLPHNIIFSSRKATNINGT